MLNWGVCGESCESDLRAPLGLGSPLVAMKVIKDTTASDPTKAKDQIFDGTLDGKLDSTRTFKIDDKGLSVETTISSDGKESIAELYEVLPVYLRDPEKQPKAAPTTIEFQVGGTWAPATNQYAEKVQAVRLTRVNGAVAVAFIQPRRVKLSPADWADTWFTKAQARNVMIDLLESRDKPAALKDAKSVACRIEPVAK